LHSDRVSDDHRNLVRVVLTLTDGTKVGVAGTATGSRHTTKVVEVDAFSVDVPLSQHMAFFRYHDRPGVVGIVGNILGEEHINIAGMQVSRDDTGHALIVLTVDSEISQPSIDRIVDEIEAHSGRAVNI